MKYKNTEDLMYGILGDDWIQGKFNDSLKPHKGLNAAAMMVFMNQFPLPYENQVLPIRMIPESKKEA